MPYFDEMRYGVSLRTEARRRAHQAAWSWVVFDCFGEYNYQGNLSAW